MKKKIFNRSLLIIMMIAAMSMSATAWAQGPGSGRGAGTAPGVKKGNPAMHMKAMLPDLSDAQIAKIKTLRIEMLKKTNPIKAQMKEKRAHLNTLAIAETADMKAINKTIDEISSLKAQMMKIMAQFRQDVRAVLTAEQRVVFDSKAGMMGMKGHGMKGHYGSSYRGQNCSGPRR